MNEHDDEIYEEFMTDSTETLPPMRAFSIARGRHFPRGYSREMALLEHLAMTTITASHMERGEGIVARATGKANLAAEKMALADQFMRDADDKIAQINEYRRANNFHIYTEEEINDAKKRLNRPYYSMEGGKPQGPEHSS